MTKAMEAMMTRMRPILTDLGARGLWQANGPNGSFLDAQIVGESIVILHYYPQGGVSHYVPGAGSNFDAMETQLHQLAAAAT